MCVLFFFFFFLPFSFFSIVFFYGLSRSSNEERQKSDPIDEPSKEFCALSSALSLSQSKNDPADQYIRSILTLSTIHTHTQTHSKERIIDHHHHHGRRRPQQNRLRRRQKNEIRDVERGEHHLHVRWYGDKRRFTERVVRVRVRKTIRDSAKSGFANHERERCHRASAIGHRENEHDFLVLVSNGRYNAKRSASFGVIPDERISGTNRENSVGARELHERSSARVHWWTFYRRRHSKIRLRRAHSFRDAGESLRYD